MTSENEMVRQAERLLELDAEIDSIVVKISSAASEQENLEAERKAICTKLHECVGNNISTKYIPLGNALVIVDLDKGVLVKGNVVRYDADA